MRLLGGRWDSFLRGQLQMGELSFPRGAWLHSQLGQPPWGSQSGLAFSRAPSSSLFPPCRLQPNSGFILNSEFWYEILPLRVVRLNPDTAKWSLEQWGWGEIRVSALHVVEISHGTYSRPTMFVFPVLHPWIQPSSDQVAGSVCTIYPWKNPHECGPGQFKGSTVFKQTEEVFKENVLFL